jgi:hypothetical protein
MIQEAIEKLNRVNGVLLVRMIRIAEKKKKIDPGNEKQLCMDVEEVENILKEAQEGLNEAIYDLEGS